MGVKGELRKSPLSWPAAGNGSPRLLWVWVWVRVSLSPGSTWPPYSPDGTACPAVAAGVRLLVLLLLLLAVQLSCAVSRLQSQLACPQRLNPALQTRGRVGVGRQRLNLDQICPHFHFSLWQEPPVAFSNMSNPGKRPRPVRIQ